MTTAPDWWVHALAQTVYGIRMNAKGAADADRWDQPGIKAAIVKLLTDCPPVDVAKVMIAGADNPKIKTPAGVPEPGPHWEGTGKSRATGQRQRCGVHHVLLQAGDCPKCAERLTSSRPANFQDVYHRAMQAAREEREAQKREDMQP